MDRKYKDPLNRVYQIDEWFTHLLPPGCVEITDAEAMALLRPLEVVKAAKVGELQQARDQAAAANVTVQGKVFSAEPKIADLFAKLADRKRRGKPSALTSIFDVNGSPVTPNPTTLEAIEDAIAAQAEDAWNKYGTLVGQVMAATNNTQVEAIAW